MKAKILFLVLLVVIGKNLFSINYPIYILNQKYGVVSKALDSIRDTIFRKDYTTALSDLKDLEKWAFEKGDKQLKNGFKLYQFRLAILKDKADSIFEKKLLEFIKEADENNLKYIKTEGVQLIGEYYWRIKNYASGLENYIYAYQTYSQFPVDDFPHKTEFLYELGGKYYYFRDFKTAKKYFLEVWHNIPFEKISNGISKLNTLALCYGNLEEYDSASYYFHLAKDYSIKTHSELWLGIISGNLGNNYLKQNKVDEAIPLMEKNIELSRKYKALNDLAVSLSEYGALLQIRNETKRNMDLQLEALQILNKKRMNLTYVLTSRIFPNVAKAYASSGNMAMAYIYLDSAKCALDSVQKQRNMVFVSGVQHKIDIEKHKEELLQKEAELKQQKLFKNTFLVGLGVVLLFAVVFFRQRNKISKEKRKSDKEKQRSDELLLNILPAEVADELKETGSAKAKSFENVTVLFTDFVGFTLVSEKLSPEQLVEEIHHCFTEFDKIVERNGLEKIKTIGDAYLAVCGMPVEIEDHAKKTVIAAMEIMEFIRKREIEGGHFQIRIGINSGSVVAGIVGVKKFAYDIWGDTVNTAARMEQHSANGKINISGSTYELVKNDFKCIHRGKIEAKHKGEVDMYYVEKKVE